MRKRILFGITAIVLTMTVGIAVASNGNDNNIGNGNGNDKETARVIADTVGAMDKLNFKMKGCKIVHELKDATALECPKNIVSKLKVREDEVLQIMDMEANVQINADNVWALGYTGSGVTVAVLDTGIDTNHPELTSSIVGGKGFGYLAYEDDHGHGTHVSGIITADGVGGNPLGFAKGAAPDAGIWMAKVCNASGSCYSSDIAAAIEYVVNNNIAKVMSISLGGGGTSRANCDRDYLARKVNWAVDNGVTVVAAAGNTSGKVSSPGCASKAIAVGAVDKRDVRAYFSGTGYALDIMAPGVSIYSSVIDGGYDSWSGTSMATPHISAVVALMKQANSGLTDSQIKDALYETAKDLGTAGWDKYYGWGRVDALAAVKYVKPAEPECADGQTQSCYTGPEGTELAGVCSAGTQTCSAGVWGSCVGEVLPSVEICDSLDNDCDGLTDENLGQTTCGVGACMASVDNCVSGELQTCTPGTPTEEICDSIDNDCNGLIDEDGICGDVLCWSGANQYLYRAADQASKFCKCAEGNYEYNSYKLSTGKKLAYKYKDTADNISWDATSVFTRNPISSVICADGIAYSTGEDYLWPK